MQKHRFATVISLFSILFLLGLNSCDSGKSNVTTVAATVNGREIKMEAVERLIKQQARGDEAKLSQLELTQARLQVLEQLIQQEVLFQKAEAEKTVPTDDEVNQELNKLKTGSGKSAEEFEKQMKDAGETEGSVREGLKKSLAIQKLVDKITGKVEPPRDSEIEAYYNGNKNQFVKRRGVRLATIVVDPSDSGEGDTTKNADEANARIQEISQQLNPDNFSSVARDKSEDPSRFQGGELGNISEADLQKTFSPQIAAGFMNPMFKVGSVVGPISMPGKAYFFKLLERIEKDEAQTLETPGVREQITTNLTNARKQLLQDSYAVLSMNEARIVNNLARKVVDNPNELSGARPAAANTNSAAANTNSAVSNSNSAANSNAKPAEPASSNKAASEANAK